MSSARKRLRWRQKCRHRRGVTQGTADGESDDWCYQARRNLTTGCDLHALVLHLLGIDHEKLTMRTNGVDRSLTDVPLVKESPA